MTTILFLWEIYITLMSFLGAVKEMLDVFNYKLLTFSR